MKNFNLGIIGNCLSCQPWINVSDLYHRQLKIKLLQQDNIHLKVHIAGNSNLEPRKRFEELIRKQTLDGILYVLRSAYPKQLIYFHKDLNKKPFITFDFFNYLFFKNKIIYSEHPNVIALALKLRKQKDMHDIYLEDSQKDNPPKRKFLGIPLNKMNFLVAKYLGLDSLVINNELEYLLKLYRCCLNKKIPLFVLGPIPDLKKLKDKNNFLFLKKMQKKLLSKILKMNIPNYFLSTRFSEEGNAFYKKDLAHLSVEGHAFLAKELYPIICPWMKKVLIEKNI